MSTINYCIYYNPSNYTWWNITCENRSIDKINSWKFCPYCGKPIKHTTLNNTITQCIT